LKDYDSVKLMSLAGEARAFGEHSKVDDVKAHVMWHDSPFLHDPWIRIHNNLVVKLEFNFIAFRIQAYDMLTITQKGRYPLAELCRVSAKCPDSWNSTSGLSFILKQLNQEFFCFPRSLIQ